MINNHYSIYINKVLQLAETIVIKSTASVEGLNQFVTDYYGPNRLDKLNPKTWKYYLNISGEYHFSDKLMYVTSMDTLENVIFSKETLAIHRATAREYQYGTRKYKELVAQYPQQEMLILGILYPADIDEAIAAPDGKILSYPLDLVEPNEYSLIAKLQKWIDGYKIRWVNNQFAISDELYSATQLGIMYLNLVPAILTIRLEACKTNEAHSFHVRQYLASHGMLDVYLNQLTLKQALFFYRNIAYIERNTGQQNTFEWLVEHIMSERNIPIAEYVMRHDLSKQPTEVYPSLAFRKRPINLGYQPDPRDTRTLEQILDKQDVVARDNSLYKADNAPVIRETMENSMSNVVLTKALESSMVDYTNSSPYTLEDTLVNHWLFLATSGWYRAYIGINNPITGERIPLTVLEAYTFMWYAFCYSAGIELTTIPQVFAKRVQRIPLPSIDDLMSVVDHKLVPRSLAEQALSYQPTIEGERTIISTEAFYNKCVEINRAANIQRNLIAAQEHQARRGQVHGMVSRIYSDNICKLDVPSKLYADWFSERNIEILDFDREQLNKIYLDLVREATGMSLSTTKSVRALQTAMINMLSQLSSYSVQFLQEINSSDIRMADWAAIRFGDESTSMKGHLSLPDYNVRVERAYGKQTHGTIEYDINATNILPNLNIVYRQHNELSIKVKPRFAPGPLESRKAFMVGAPIRIKPVIELQQNSEGIIPVIGIDDYLKLTFQQRQDFKDIYDDTFVPLPGQVPPLTNVVSDTDLDGLQYPPQ